MKFFNYLIFFFIIVAGISFWYKVQYHLSQKSRENKHPNLFSFTKYLTIIYLLPVAKKYNSNILEQQSQKRANIALVIFYLSIIIGLFFSLFAK
jgi:tellurite resistance protein TehA-like permease